MYLMPKSSTRATPGTFSSSHCGPFPQREGGITVQAIKFSWEQSTFVNSEESHQAFQCPKWILERAEEVLSFTPPQ